MSEAKFTKVPWELKSTSMHPGRVKVKDKKGMEGKIIGDIRSISDAHLIAAAPEMYELLSWISTEAGRYENKTGKTIAWRELTDEILAKARGE